MPMSLVELGATVVVSLAGSAVMAGMYLKLSEQWLSQKTDQVKTLADDRFFLFVENLNAACEARTRYKKKKDITTEDYNLLLDSITAVKGPLDEYEQLNGCLFRMSRRLRNGAMLWVGVFIIVGLLYITAYTVEATGFIVVLQETHLDIIISFGFALIAVVFALLALQPLFATLRELNSIDKRSESVERIRTWEKRV